MPITLLMQQRGIQIASRLLLFKQIVSRISTTEVSPYQKISVFKFQIQIIHGFPIVSDKFLKAAMRECRSKMKFHFSSALEKIGHSQPNKKI